MISVSVGAATMTKSPFMSTWTEFFVPFTVTVAPGTGWLDAWSKTFPVTLRAPGGWADKESVIQHAKRTPTKAVRFIWIFLELVKMPTRDFRNRPDRQIVIV